MYKLEVVEQSPTQGGSIFCECLLVQRREDGTVAVNLKLRTMYFVCNKDKKITQYPSWLTDYSNQLKKLGYKL